MTHRLQIHERVDRFTLLAPLGHGGQGEVWRARDGMPPHAEVALKLIWLDTSVLASTERARREAYALARLQHPGLVSCLGIFEEPARHLLGLVLTLAEGQPLDQLVGDPRLTPAYVEALLRHLAMALDHLHQQAIVHRDVKPENIVIAPAFWENPLAPGSVKLVDLGISVDTGNSRPLTRDGAVGTPPIMTPETLDPMRWGVHPSTPSSDVFALGALGWLLLTGRHPTGLPWNSGPTDFATTYRQVSPAAWPAMPCPHSLADVLRPCLALSVAARPVNAGAVLRLLDGGGRESGPGPTFVATQVHGHVSSTNLGHPLGASLGSEPTRPPAFSTPAGFATAVTPPPYSPRPASGRPDSSSPVQVPPAPPTLRRSPERAVSPLLVAGAILGVGLLAGAGLLARRDAAPDEVIEFPQPASTAPAAPALTADLPRLLPQLPSPASSVVPVTGTEGSCACPPPSLEPCARARSVVEGVSSCESLLPDDRRWRLRVAGVSYLDSSRTRWVELIKQDPDAKVRVCAAGTLRCSTTTLAQARGSDCLLTEGLRVDHEQLRDRGLDIEIRSAVLGAVWHQEVRRHTDGIRASTLCGGLVYRWSEPSDTQVKVSFFLDD